MIPVTSSYLSSDQKFAGLSVTVLVIPGRGNLFALRSYFHANFGRRPVKKRLL